MEDDDETAGAGADDAGDLYAHDRPVDDSGRVTIPEHKRADYDISPGDDVEIIFYINDTELFVDDADVDDRGRVTIPFRLRKKHNIEAQDRVDFQILLNELT